MEVPLRATFLRRSVQNPALTAHVSFLLVQSHISVSCFAGLRGRAFLIGRVSRPFLHQMGALVIWKWVLFCFEPVILSVVELGVAVARVGSCAWGRAGQRSHLATDPPLFLNWWYHLFLSLFLGLFFSWFRVFAPRTRLLLLRSISRVRLEKTDAVIRHGHIVVGSCFFYAKTNVTCKDCKGNVRNDRSRKHDKISVF